MSAPAAFASFPNDPSVILQQCDFTGQDQLALWDWQTAASSGSGINGSTNATNGTIPSMPAPSAIADISGGGVVLNGSGISDPTSAIQYDYVQAQKIGATVSINELSGTWQFKWRGALSSLSNCAALFGMASTNTNLMGSNIVNGFGFMCNQQGTGAPAGSFWQSWVANGSGTQYSGYTNVGNLLATDTNTHTFSISFVADPLLLGAGKMTWYIDGNALDVYGTPNSVLFPQVLLRNSFAYGNVSAAANNLTVLRAGSYGNV